MASRPNVKSNEQSAEEADDDDDDENEDLIFPEEISLGEKFERVLRITKCQRKKIKKNQEIIKDLVDQVVRRDRILELSSIPGDVVEVVKMGGDSEGRRFYEIRNKEQIPYVLKTERLSPTPSQIDWEKLNEPDFSEDNSFAINAASCTENTEKADNQLQEVQNEAPSVAKEEPAEDEDEVQVLFQNFVSTAPTSIEKSETQAQRKEECEEPSPQVSQELDDNILTSDPPLEGELSGVVNEEKIPTPSVTTTQSNLTSKLEKSQNFEELDQNSVKRPSEPTQRNKIQYPAKKLKLEREKSRRSSIRVRKSDSVRRRTKRPETSSSTSPSSSSSSSTSGSSTSSCERATHSRHHQPQREKVRSKADGSYRHSFVFSDDLSSTLSKFWNSGPESWDIKYQIKLHGGQNSDLESRWFTMIQQNDVDPMTKVVIMDRKLDWIERKIESTFPDANKKIWLELRDFPQILSPDFKTHFNMDRIRGYITHLTLGPRLSSHRPHKIDSNLFLEFIFVNLRNLEFLALNSDTLDFCDDHLPLRESQQEFLLKNLTVLKFIQSKNSGSPFSANFFHKIWRRSPELNRVYGIPVEIMGSISPKSSVRSICCASALQHLISGHDYHRELRLVRDGCYQLEELDTRTFFMHRLQQLDHWVAAIMTLSQILEKNAETLKKIKVEPEGPRSLLKFPRFKNLTTLVFYMNAESSHSVVPFFGCGFKGPDFSASFPNLKNVEICNASPVKEVGLLVFQNFFPFTVFPPSCFSRVESLFLKNFSRAEVLTEIIRMFLNVKYLRLHHRIVNVSRVLPIIYQGMKKLEQMQLEVDSDGCLDTGITGIEPADLKKLRRDPRFGLFRGQDELFKMAKEMRISRSMLDLPHFSLLRIVIQPGRDLDKLSAQNPILSPVSAFFGFGFQLMKVGCKVPLLKVQIAFDEAVRLIEKEVILDSLEPMLPYVTLES